MPEKNIAVVSADSSLVFTLKDGLSPGKIEVRSMKDSPGLIRALRTLHPQLIVIDSAGPPSHCCDLCLRIHRDTGVPILLLLNGKDDDRVRALEAGATVCMAAPVNPAELIANIRAMLRWTDSPIRLPAEKKPVTVNDLIIDPDNREAKLRGKSLDLTEKEFKLLLLLARNYGHSLSRRALLEEVWGESQLGSDRAVDVHICRLKKKIAPESDKSARVVSVRGFGYRLEDR